MTTQYSTSATNVSPASANQVHFTVEKEAGGCCSVELPQYRHYDANIFDQSTCSIEQRDEVFKKLNKIVEKYGYPFELHKCAQAFVPLSVIGLFMVVGGGPAIVIAGPGVGLPIVILGAISFVVIMVLNCTLQTKIKEVRPQMCAEFGQICRSLDGKFGDLMWVVSCENAVDFYPKITVLRRGARGGLPSSEVAIAANGPNVVAMGAAAPIRVHVVKASAPSIPMTNNISTSNGVEMGDVTA